MGQDVSQAKKGQDGQAAPLTDASREKKPGQNPRQEEFDFGDEKKEEWKGQGHKAVRLP